MVKRLNVISQDTAQSAVYILNTGCEDSLDILTTAQPKINISPKVQESVTAQLFFSPQVIIVLLPTKV